MSDLSDAFMSRARESLLGAESEFANGRYNNTANRAYYACFQAAISALVLADIRPPGKKDDWSHKFVQSQFSGVLVGRRKRYDRLLSEFLIQTRVVREQADYDDVPVSSAQARRTVGHARRFVDAIAELGEVR